MTSDYKLTSDLAWACVRTGKIKARRKLAWVNSICLLFLIVGLAGARTSLPPPKTPPPLEETAPVIIETLPPPTVSEAKPQEQPQEQKENETPPAVVVVTPETPAINFSVPTLGTLVVPNAMAKAPPPMDLKPIDRVPVRHAPQSIAATGSGGDRPQPPYPKMALELGQQGTVILRITADSAGIITGVDIKESSGYPILDHSTADFVKRHWTVPPGGNVLYEAAISYRLE